MAEFSITDYPILIVDEDRTSRVMLEHSLRKAGHPVQAVDEGKRALEILEKKHFPILLIDWPLSKIDGTAFCRAVRINETRGYVYIILLTKKRGEKQSITEQDAGADDYLAKPLRRNDLLRSLSAAMKILQCGDRAQQTREGIRHLAVTDSLTGAYNEAYLVERMPQEITRAQRYGHKLSVILADIDKFKRFRDSFGRPTGDFILKEFVSMLREGIREDVDWLVRFGGEKILLVFPETRLENVIRTAERLRKRVESSVIRINEGHHIMITASMGVTELTSCGDQDGYALDVLIDQAEKCLNQADRDGGNRIRVYSKWDLGIDRRFLIPARKLSAEGN